MKKLPEFANDKELADWFDTHDTAEYLEGAEEAEEKFEVVRTSKVRCIACDKRIFTAWHPSLKRLE